MKFDSQGDLWMAGQRQVWHWDLIANKLRRIELSAKLPETHRLSALGSDGLSLYVASTSGLFQLTWEPLRIFHYQLNDSSNGFSLGFSGSGDRLAWLHASGVYRIDRYGKALIKLRGLDFIRQRDQVHYAPKANALWLLRKNHLMLVKDVGPQNAAQVVYQAKGRLKDILQWEDRIVTFTSRSVLFFTEGGQLIQSVPVASGRRLMALAFSPQHHHYLFDDGVIETYNLTEQTRTSFVLPEKALQKSAKIAVWEDRVALLNGAKPRLFRLPKAVD